MEKNESCDGLSCSLTADELRDQKDVLIPGLFRRCEKVDELQSGFRFKFMNRPRLLIELAELIEKERVCCDFLRFVLTVEESAGCVLLEISGPPGTVELIRELLE